MSLEPSTRRVNQRHSVNIPSVIHLKGGTREAFITNISVGGLYIKDTFAYENKQVISVEFSIPNLNSPIMVDSIVRWLERVDEEIIGVGVQFVGLKAKEVWALTRYFATLQSQEM